jgi:hypothetical protein
MRYYDELKLKNKEIKMSYENITPDLRKSFAQALRTEVAEAGIGDQLALGAGSKTWTWNQLADEIEQGTQGGLEWLQAHPPSLRFEEMP